MKKSFIILLGSLLVGFGTSVMAQCPFFSTPLYPDLTYNLNSTPWPFELQVFGDTTNAQVEWYRYLSGQQASDAVLYTGEGSNTVSECLPQTDEAVRNTYYCYFCVLKTPECPQGITSSVFTVQVAIGSDCWVMGSTFRFESSSSSYKEGETITLTAYYDGYGGYHYYTWFFNGDTLREDENHIITNDPDNFNYTVLTITNCQPSDAGTYSVTIRDGDACVKNIASPKTITVKPKEYDYLVFDDNNQTHLWSDPKNWWPAYNRLPAKTDSAVIRQRCYVDIANAQVGPLMLEYTADTALVIRSTGALLLAGRLHGYNQSSLLIEADAKGNGALVLGAENRNIPATVQFYALSEQMSSAAPVWQYMGYPMQDSPLFSNAYNGAAFYAWTNTPNLAIGGNWQELDAATDHAKPFTGYCMTQPAKTTYSFQGVLNNPVAKTLTVAYNDQGTYPGFALMANSWTAPIDIAALEEADFGAADATVYIMNTGTYQEAISQQPNASSQATGTARGQYNTIPVHAASYVANALRVIPPMQGFFVHTNQATTLNFDYTKAVYTPALTKVSTTPTRAPQSGKPSPVTDNPSVLRLAVSGFGAEDEVYILSGSEFTTSFDNGWDGRKPFTRSPLTMAVESADGPLSVAAVPELENTELTLSGGLDKYYTITVVGAPSLVTANLYLLDPETEVLTPLIDGAQYTITCTRPTRRLKIVRLNTQIENDSMTKFIHNGHLYIQIDGALYDACGRKIK